MAFGIEAQKRTVMAVEVFRAIAVMLVMNSHYEHVYPIKMDAGGELGLAIFFLLTGYLLANIKPGTRFVPWFLKHFIRAYVPFLFVNTLNWAMGYITINSLSDAFSHFVWPMTAYWFVGHIILLYILFYVYRVIVYPTFRDRGTVATMIVVFAMSIVVFAVQIGYYRTYAAYARILWFLCMLLGAYIRDHEAELTKRRHPIVLSIVLAASFLAHLAGKYLVASQRLPQLWISVFLFCIVFACAGMALLLSFESVCKTIMGSPIGALLGIMSAASLEIYLVQGIWIRLLTHLVFPVNWLLITALNIVTGYLLYRLFQMITRPICARLTK